MLFNGAAAMAQPIVLDTFETGQGPLLQSGLGTNNSIVDGTGILSTERNMRVSSQNAASVTATVAAGAYTFTRVVSGTAELWWDGNNNTTTFDPTGLSGLDLTAGGQNSFRVTVTSSSSGSQNMRLIVWTDGGNLSQRDFTLPTGGGIVDLTYASFTVAGGAGASFNNVGALFLASVNVAGDWTATIDDLRTTPVELMSFEVD